MPQSEKIPTSRPDELSVTAQVSQDIASFPFRQPVIADSIFGQTNQLGRDSRQSSDGNAGSRDSSAAHGVVMADRRWLTVTESVRRAVIDSPTVRGVLTEFSSQPLGEAIPGAVIEKLQGLDERSARVARVSPALGRTLSLEAVPDALLFPDIQHAPPIQTPGYISELLTASKLRTPANYENDVQRMRESVVNYPGVSEHEKQLVTRRYRYARDIKLLGIMSELYDHPFVAEAESGTSESVANITHILPSGTKIVMNREAYSREPALFDATKWQKRHQIKDRVYAVTVGGKEYILKERKTDRHADTKDGGHIDGRTSAQEFEIAQTFANLGTIEEGEISLRWEKPLGYVESPDGYQFCMFEREPGLAAISSVSQLEKHILAAEDAYTEDFINTKRRAKEIYEQRKDLLVDTGSQVKPMKPSRFALTKAARRRNSSIQNLPSADELTYQEFASLKARQLYDRAEEVLSDKVREMGYTNSDFDGSAIRVAEPDGSQRAKVEIIGFDFEYYAYSPVDAKRKKDRRVELKKSGLATSSTLDGFSDNRQIRQAAKYSMMEENGWELPPKYNT